MPALTSLSKEDIVDRLTTIIRKQEAEIEKLKAEAALMDRKMRHGCYDANCAECDQPKRKRNA